MNNSSAVTGVSQIVEKIETYNWVVCNYKNFHRAPEAPLTSPCFTVHNDDKSLKFKFSLTPFYLDHNSTLDLICTSVTGWTVPIYLKVYFNVFDSAKKCVLKSGRGVVIRGSDMKNRLYEFKPVQGTFEFKKKIFFEDFTIACRILYPVLVNQLKENDFIEKVKSLKRKCLDDFEQDMEAEKYSDFIITAPCGKKLKTHRFILSSRSPVFAALIDSDMIEKKEGCVRIDDVSYDVLKEMLRFMYSAKVNNLENFGTEILQAAEKYQIDGLKNLCMEYLFKNISVDNAAKALDLSYCLDLVDLRKRAMKIIKSNAAAVVKSEGYKSLSNGSLSGEIIRALADE